MCGITGIIGREKLSEKLHSAVSRVNNSQIHRGPDGVGEFSSENILLAMRRLAIIDKKGGWQPLFNEDKSLVLIFNGEIYNYIELRERLKNLGHKFQTDADGEVILHLYEFEFLTDDYNNYNYHLYGVQNDELLFFLQSVLKSDRCRF